MTIQLNPEQEQVINRAIQLGLVKTVDQAVEVGMDAIRRNLEARLKKPAVPAANLVDLFAASPFAGSDLRFERDNDLGREVSL